ncbi:MAG: transcriptional regulator [Cucumibacter sp.]
MTKRTKLGLEIEAGLEDAIAFVRGEVARPVRRIEAPSAEHVKTVRKMAAKSRPDFERRFGIPERTLRAWETGQSTPDMAARSLLAMIEHDPDSIAAIYAAVLKDEARGATTA